MPTAESPPERAADASPPTAARGFLRSTFALAAFGGLLLWLAQPGTDRLLGLPGAPLGLLGWVAAVPWVALILRPEPLSRWRCVQVWLGGCCYWALTLYWVCYPHPLTPLGLPPLAGYLALYLLAFVLLTRRAVLRVAAPVWVAAPLVWVGLEYVQARLFTGFQVGVPSHTQAGFPVVMQISDATGAYGVSFVLVMSGAALALALHRGVRAHRRLAGLATTLLVVIAVLFYGHVRLSEDGGPPRGPVVALIQGATRATWDPDPKRHQQIMDEQVDLTRQAGRFAEAEGLSVDLFVWPESMFRSPLVTRGNAPTAIDDLPEPYRPTATSTQRWFDGLTSDQHAAFLLGLDRYDVAQPPTGSDQGEQTVYNTAAFVDSSGQLTGFYDKTHRVPFGEYIPFAENMPAMYYLTPMEGGLGEGAVPVSMTLDTANGSFRLAPNICYESVIPHVIRRQVATLTAQGEAPDLLVNITNDAWFWGATELDMHLACGQYRAVENRTPMAVAANTGLSALIDGSGRVLRKSRRMQPDVIVTRVPLDARSGFYARHGDWFALGCFVATVVVLLTSLALPPGSPAGHAAGRPRLE